MYGLDFTFQCSEPSVNRYRNYDSTNHPLGPEKRIVGFEREKEIDQQTSLETTEA